MSLSTPPPKRDVYTVRNRDRHSTVATRVTVADTSRERRAGLKNTATLPDQAGLWITPCEAIHTFGMKVHIDAVFLDRDFRVRKIWSGLTPRKIAFCLRASSVLELPSGAAARSDISVGDRLEFLLNREALVVQ